MTPAAPTIKAPEIKYGPKLVLSHPGRSVVANSHDVTVCMPNATGIISTDKIVTDLFNIFFCSGVSFQLLAMKAYIFCCQRGISFNLSRISARSGKSGKYNNKTLMNK